MIHLLDTWTALILWLKMRFSIKHGQSKISCGVMEIWTLLKFRWNLIIRRWAELTGEWWTNMGWMFAVSIGNSWKFWTQATVDSIFVAGWPWIWTDVFWSSCWSLLAIQDPEGKQHTISINSQWMCHTCIHSPAPATGPKSMRNAVVQTQRYWQTPTIPAVLTRFCSTTRQRMVLGASKTSGFLHVTEWWPRATQQITWKFGFTPTKLLEAWVDLGKGLVNVADFEMRFCESAMLGQDWWV